MCSNTFYDGSTGIYIVSILMPSLPSRYCLGVISQMLRMRRHCSPNASRDVLVGTFANIIVSRNRSRQRQRHRTTYKSPARLESHLYRCLRIYVIGSRTNKEWPPLRLQRDRGFVQSACRAHSDRQAHGLGKVSLRPCYQHFRRVQWCRYGSA